MTVCGKYFVGEKEYQKQYRQEHKKESKKYQRQYRQSNKGKLAGKKYEQSEKGKLTNARKHAKRQRNLSFTLLMSNPFPNEILVDYHHINNVFVIPVPRQVHKSMYGDNHRVKVNNWIEEIIGDVGVC